LEGKNRRASTKTESLSKAKDIAEDWYLELRGRQKIGELHGEKTFADAAKKFMGEYEILTEGERNERWVQDHYRCIRKYLNPYFGKMGLSQVIAGTEQEYHVGRMEKEEGKKAPPRSILHHETVTLPERNCRLSLNYTAFARSIVAKVVQRECGSDLCLINCSESPLSANQARQTWSCHGLVPASLEQ